jgi:hypothetical protein
MLAGGVGAAAQGAGGACGEASGSTLQERF